MHKNIITAQIKIKLTEKEKTMIKKQAEKQKQDALKEKKIFTTMKTKSQGILEVANTIIKKRHSQARRKKEASKIDCQESKTKTI